MPVAINPHKERESMLEKIGQAVQVARTVQGMDVDTAKLEEAKREAAQKAEMYDQQKQTFQNAQTKFGQEQDALKRRLDPNSQESKLARADAQSLLGVLSNSEISKKNPGAFSPLLQLASDPNTNAETLSSAFEKSPLLKHTTALANKAEGAGLAAAVWGNRKEMQQERQDMAAHQRNITKLKSDPQLAKRIGNYQNLENALSNVVNAEALTPQQIHEFQQTVRNSLGIGAGGVGEREETYIHSLGMKAENWKQMLTGDPSTMSKDSTLVKHFKDLAQIEQKNISKQMEKRINAVTAGNGSVYARRPDLKQDLLDAVEATLGQFQESPREQMVQGGGLPGMESAQAATPGARPSPKPQTATPAAAHPQASAAEEWAKKNPTDPRAADILNRLGVQ